MHYFSEKSDNVIETITDYLDRNGNVNTNINMKFTSHRFWSLAAHSVGIDRGKGIPVFEPQFFPLWRLFFSASRKIDEVGPFRGLATSLLTRLDNNYLSTSTRVLALVYW